MTDIGKVLPLPADKRDLKSDGFLWTVDELMHDVRRRAMLEKYPHIKDLYGTDARNALFCLVTVMVQFICGFLARNADPWVLLVACHVVSGTLNHTLLLAQHEVSHNLFFANPSINKWFSFFANLPLGIPMAATFKRYHTEHHWGLAVDKVDQDIPSVWEAKFFSNPPLRAIWLFLQPVFYGLRPVVMNPKNVNLDEICNLTIQVAFDMVVLYFWGPKSLLYFVGGAILGMGWNPISGHFLAEHLVFFPGQETASYYGPLNWLTYNVGYHVEHHDFPRIPSTRLPQLRKIAPEFYQLHAHYSWTMVILKFIFSGDLSLFSRYKRKTPSGK